MSAAGTGTATAAPVDAVPERHRDVSLPLWWYGYRFISRRMDRLRATAFQARLLGSPTVFLRGRSAAQLFYDNTKFTRVGAIPGPIKSTLFGRDTVHGLDGHAHHHRKAMFLGLLDDDAVEQVTDIAALHWHERLTGRGPRRRIVLFHEAVQVIAAAVCDWAGMATRHPEFPGIATELARIVDGFGSAGMRHVRARVARLRCRRWARGYVSAVRDGRLHPPPHRAVAVVARHRDERGRLLPLDVAADELVNVIRPTVAVAWLITFAGLALHREPGWAERIAGGDRAALTAFCQEVRRYYPFAPFLAARARKDFQWQGHRFTRGGRVVLDLYGTDHDPRLWDRPEEFDPGRFLAWRFDPFSLIPQGGGDAASGHRCPGEALTMGLLEQATLLLARGRAEVPRQNLSFSLSRIPSRVTSGVVLVPRG
ncbi:fatty-acid peroxygenase [Stackebrandtia albiflava]|uniref:Fatty-acid peroxygenase n=1 Tax=Stackebrandtia albiflava TaxID=406432 RepID=A0A562V3S3_9ACTN|nr:cytochrome P450 [Stackebrandtia albiflava]TWJ12549.1 fatty-acid peroxygenase [Stackebrandtia albiflava]